MPQFLIGEPVLRHDAEMSAQRKFQDETQVEVWREKRGEWVRGTVHDYRIGDDGIGRYFVQLAGYGAMQASNPDHWFLEDVIRAARR